MLGWFMLGWFTLGWFMLGCMEWDYVSSISKLATLKVNGTVIRSSSKCHVANIAEVSP